MMQRFNMPGWVQEHLFEYNNWRTVPAMKIEKIRKGLSRFHAENPVVSIVLPVWNEEKAIVRTLSSFAAMEVPFPAELIVVNNNSTDDTAEILNLLGVKKILETRQGIAHARLAGLNAAKGQYHLCGDGDSLYPPHWIRHMVGALQDERITCVYGNYSFIPSGNTSRTALGIYELFAEALFELRRIRREFLNVRGANFGFRRDLGLAVKGFVMPITRVYDNQEGKSFVVYGEDGRMGRKLGELGKLRLLHTDEVRIWTSSRRILGKKTLWKSFTERIRREVFKLYEYVAGPKKLKHTTDHLI